MKIQRKNVKCRKEWRVKKMKRNYFLVKARIENFFCQIYRVITLLF